MDPDVQQHAIGEGNTLGELARAAVQCLGAFGGPARVGEGDHEAVAQPLQQLAPVAGNDLGRSLEQ